MVNLDEEEENRRKKGIIEELDSNGNIVYKRKQPKSTIKKLFVLKKIFFYCYLLVYS